jgi:hypothetical protein
MRNRRLEGSSDVLVGRWLPRRCHQCQARAAIGHVGIEHDAVSIVMAMGPNRRPSCPARGQECRPDMQDSAKDAWAMGIWGALILCLTALMRSAKHTDRVITCIDSIHLSSVRVFAIMMTRMRERSCGNLFPKQPGEQNAHVMVSCYCISVEYPLKKYELDSLELDLGKI